MIVAKCVAVINKFMMNLTEQRGVSERLFKLYKLSAEKGNVRAQLFLALCYEHGLGTEKDMEKAFKWYKISAEKGINSALCFAALCYQSNGDNDIDSAFKWYKVSAEQGDHVGQVALALCYEYGIGTEKDVDFAFKWYKCSAEHEDAFSYTRFFLARCYHDGKGTGMDMNSAFKWYKISAEQGNENAQYNLGLCYEYGVVVERDLKESIKWYKLCAENLNHRYFPIPDLVDPMFLVGRERDAPIPKIIHSIFYCVTSGVPPQSDDKGKLLLDDRPIRRSKKVLGTPRSRRLI
jgi:hypothetical protein